MKSRLLAVGVALTFFAFAPAAFAQDVCTVLRGQLAQAGGGNSQALQSQLGQAQANLSALQTQFRQMGCNVLFQAFAPPQCAPVRQALSQAQAQVANLQQAIARGGQGGATRQQILAAMAANNCGTQQRNNNPPPAPANYGTFRTVCVRPVDGFWFPIKYSAGRQELETDAALCRAACQGADLYFHRNPGEDMEQAVNLAGDRYVDLPNAFAFRTAYDPANACQVSPELLAAIERPRAEPAPVVDAPEAPPAPMPVPRPVFAEDPDTLANRAGGFVPGETAFPGPALAGAPTDPAAGVRLVGPAYYYAR